MARFWQLFAQHYEELLETPKGTTNEILLPFNIPEARGKEMVKEMEKARNMPSLSHLISTNTNTRHNKRDQSLLVKTFTKTPTENHQDVHLHRD